MKLWEVELVVVTQIVLNPPVEGRSNIAVTDMVWLHRHSILLYRHSPLIRHAE